MAVGLIKDKDEPQVMSLVKINKSLKVSLLYKKTQMVPRNINYCVTPHWSISQRPSHVQITMDFPISSPTSIR